MFKPTICVRAPRELQSALQEAFTSTAPHDCSSSFGGDQQKTLAFKPRFEWGDTPQSPESGVATPHLVLYLFFCAGRTNFQVDERNKLRDFCSKCVPRGVPMVPIFVNDPKVKEKGIFSQTGSVLTLLQNEYPNGQMINVKNNVVKKADMPKVWQVMVSEILNGVTNRIKELSKALEGEPSTDTFRNCMKLIFVYDSVGLHKQVESVVSKALDLIGANAGHFKSFLGPKSLKYEFGVVQGDEHLDKLIMANPEPSEFDVRFILTRHIVHAHMSDRRPDQAIAAVLKCIRELEWRVKENSEPLNYHFWLAHSLYKLLGTCEREKEAGREETKRLYEQVLQWYIVSLSALRRVWRSQDKSTETEDTDDPLQDSSSALPPQASDWPDMFKLVTTKVKFEEEMLRLLNNQFDFSYSQGHGKTAASIARRLLEYAPDTRNFRGVSAMIYCRSKCAHILGEQIVQDVQKMTIQEQIRTLSYALCDKKLTCTKEVCARINELIDQEGFQSIKMFAHMPIAVTIQSNNRYIEGEQNTVTFQVKCHFEGEINCRQFRVGFTSRDPGPFVEFTAADFILKDGAVAVCKGKFNRKGPYWPCYVRIWKGKGVIHVPLPPAFFWIEVAPMPKPITMAVEMPRYMLPRCWQIALLKLDVLRPLSNLDIRVSGLAFKPAALRGKDKVVVEPTTGFSFAEVADGSYEVYLPIKPDKSGSLKIEASASDQEIVHEVPFTVSDFLRMKAIYKSSTKIAQLSVSLESASDIVLTDMKFYNGDNEEIGSESIGLPVSLKLTNSFVMSILDSEPDYAVTFLQQKGLEPFSLRLNVEKIGQDQAVVLQPIAPMTIMLPNEFGI